MKQETIEEAFLNTLIDKEFKTKGDYIAFKGAEFGAKWQAERMYSEEDLKEAFKGGNKTSWIKRNSFKEWFEQFKKK